MSAFQNYKQTFLQYYQRHETLVTICVFFLGFFFDLLTLGKIDDLQNIIQQLFYLILICFLLVFEITKEQLSSNMRTKLKLIENYHNLLIHFLFGSLLSVYTIFYFTSASLLSSFIFLGLIAGLTLANEFEFFQKFGTVFRFILFQICLISFLLILIPIIVGSLGFFSFLPGILLSSGFIFFIYFLLNKLQFSLSPELKSKLILTFSLTHFIFIIFYYLSIIPPVPVALKKIGIYYKVEKKEGKYLGHYMSTWPYFWHNGSQIFQARLQDELVVIFSIYSPTSFKDRVILKWDCRDESTQIQTTDLIEIEIKGGREEGYRGFARKRNYPTGNCDISVLTSDHRTLGSIWANITLDSSTDEREFLTESF